LLEKLKPLFLSFSRDELEVIWRGYLTSRGLDPNQGLPFATAEDMWNQLSSGGVYQAELAAPLLTDPEARHIVQKLLGAEV